MSIYYSYIKEKKLNSDRQYISREKGNTTKTHSYGETPNSFFFFKESVSSMLAVAAANACASDH